MKRRDASRPAGTGQRSRQPQPQPAAAAAAAPKSPWALATPRQGLLVSPRASGSSAAAKSSSSSSSSRQRQRDSSSSSSARSPRRSSRKPISKKGQALSGSPSSPSTPEQQLLGAFTDALSKSPSDLSVLHATAAAADTPTLRNSSSAVDDSSAAHRMDLTAAMSLTGLAVSELEGEMRALAMKTTETDCSHHHDNPPGPARDDREGTETDEGSALWEEAEEMSAHAAAMEAVLVSVAAAQEAELRERFGSELSEAATLRSKLEQAEALVAKERAHKALLEAKLAEAEAALLGRTRAVS
jgi:hypothetical protein